MNEDKSDWDLKIARRIKNRKRVARREDSIFLFPVDDGRDLFEMRRR